MDQDLTARQSRMSESLNKAVRQMGAAAKRNYFAAFALALIGVLASVAAGVLAFADADKILVGGWR